MSQRICTTLVVCLWLCLHQPNAAGAIPDTWRDDADMRDVYFVDSSYGWAVGDHGTIWHSQDGGEKWRRQQSNVTCQLSTVHFVDRQNGFAAGGLVTPISQRSRGIVLKTSDGGKTWEPISGLLLPRVTRIHFSSSKTGYAVGSHSAMHPSGAWATRDGGRTWSPLPGITGEHWRDAAFVGDAAILSSTSGMRAFLSEGRLLAPAPAQVLPMSWRKSVTQPSEGIALVAGGGLHFTADRGNEWHPIGMPDLLGVRSIVAHRNELWIGGNPSSRILHSRDMGGSWEAQFVPATMPIHRLRHFHHASDGNEKASTGEHHLWAVGARGMILGSKDGGQTWKRKRGGSERIALLGIFPDERCIPWDLIAQVSAADSWRVHCVVLAGRESDETLRCELEHRLEDAAMHVGATAEVLTRLPWAVGVDLPANELVTMWQKADPDVMQRLSGNLVRLLRVYRPDVVVTSLTASATSNHPTGAQQLLDQLVTNAREFAAATEGFPEQLQTLGLQPWTVSRHLNVQSVKGTVPSLETVPSVRGESVASLSNRAERIVGNSNDVGRAWSLFASIDGEARNFGRYPLGGIAANFGAAQRRARTIDITGSANRTRLLQRAARTRRIIASEQLVGNGQTRLEQLERLVHDDDEVGTLLFDLASQQPAAEADQTLRHLAKRHPDHPLVEAALIDLVRHHTSAERMWRNHSSRIEHQPAETIDANIRQASAEFDVTGTAAQDPLGSSELEVLDNADVFVPDDATSIGGPADQPSWRTPGISLKLAQEIKSKRPDLYAEPAVVFPLAAALRTDGQLNPARSLYRRVRSLPASSRWRSHATRELQLLEAGALPADASAAWSCREVDTRPHLDGDLSDACWQQATEKQLSGSTSNPTTIFIARDHEFLYLAAKCPKDPRAEYLPPRRPRPRDPDLSRLDRVRFAFDINRDYRSWWTFEIDHRGWTHESLLDDASWNPKYFVASKMDEVAWTIEAAIPLAELASNGAADEFDHWGVGVERVVPNVFVERWQPIPAGMPGPGIQGILKSE